MSRTFGTPFRGEHRWIGTRREATYYPVPGGMGTSALARGGAGGPNPLPAPLPGHIPNPLPAGMRPDGTIFRSPHLHARETPPDPGLYRARAGMIRRARRDMGISQEDLAAEMSTPAHVYTQTELSLLERQSGPALGVAWINQMYAERLAEVLGPPWQQYVALPPTDDSPATGGRR